MNFFFSAWDILGHFETSSQVLFNCQRVRGSSAKTQATKHASLPYPSALRFCAPISNANPAGNSQTTKNFLFCLKSRCAFRNGSAQRADDARFLIESSASARGCLIAHSGIFTRLPVRADLYSASIIRESITPYLAGERSSAFPRIASMKFRCGVFADLDWSLVVWTRG